MSSSSQRPGIDHLIGRHQQGLHRREARAFAVVATASFTFFETRSIKFANVVYGERMHVECRLALNQLLESRRATWPRKRRRQRRQRRQPRRKRSSGYYFMASGSV